MQMCVQELQAGNVKVKLNVLKGLSTVTLLIRMETPFPVISMHDSFLHMEVYKRQSAAISNVEKGDKLCRFLKLSKCKRALGFSVWGPFLGL